MLQSRVYPAYPILPVETPLLIPVDAIRPNPHQPRKTFNDASIAELAASIKSSGIIQPLVVRKTTTASS